MILSRVYPGPTEPLELDAEGTRERLLELYRPEAEHWLRINMVTSVSGSAAGADGTSETLTNASDRRILGVIRQLSDVVVVGAASVRAEGYQLPRRSRLAIVTSSGDLSGHRLDADSAAEILVMCPPAAVERAKVGLPGAHVIAVDSEKSSVRLPHALDLLREQGLTSIVCEGGPSLASQLVGHGLVDEFCLTTSPQLGGVNLPLLADTVPVSALNLRQTIIDDDGFVFSRWTLRELSASG